MCNLAAASHMSCWFQLKCAMRKKIAIQGEEERLPEQLELACPCQYECALHQTVASRSLGSRRWLDFDIEGSAVTYTEEVDRRNKALAKLQVPGRPWGGCWGGPELPALLEAASDTNCIAHWCRSPRRPLERLAPTQAANPGLIISYCLPVLPVGLTRFGVAMLANAVQNNVRVDVVQVGQSALHARFSPRHFWGV